MFEGTAVPELAPNGSYITVILVVLSQKPTALPPSINPVRVGLTIALPYCCLKFLQI
jgi:hypothetical protein